MTTTPQTPTTVETLMKLNKPELQVEYKNVIGTDADPALTKEEIAKAIVDKLTPAEKEGEKGSEKPSQEGPGDEQSADKQGNGETTTPQNPTTVEIPQGHLKLVKIEDDEIIDTTVMPQAAFDNLPPHKFGWSIAKPAELA